MTEGSLKTGDLGRSEPANQPRLLVYPASVLNADRKIDEAEKRILKALVRVKDLQLADRQRKHQFEPLTQPNDKAGANLEITSWGKLWQKEDEIVLKIVEYINKCSMEYESKLQQEQLRFIRIRNELIERIGSKDQEIGVLKEQVDNLQKETEHANNKIKKLEADNEHVQNYRKNQKERITELLIQEKQEIFSKYNQIEKENMAVLQFAHRMEDIVQKKNADDREDDLNKISYIKEIQLEASKFYASLTNPIIQEILNAFTQVVNALHKKLDKRDDIKAGKAEKNTKNSNRMTIMRLKSSQGRDTSSADFQILHLKQQLAKTVADYENRLKQVENLFNFQKEKSASLKKKIDRLEIQLQKRNKEMETYQYKQIDTTKKIQWLEQSLLDYQRKLKMQNEQITIAQENRLSSPDFLNEGDIYDTREKSKSMFVERNKPMREIRFETSELHCQLTKKSEEIEELKGKIKNVNKILMGKEETLMKNQKRLQEIEARLKQKKQLISAKQHQIQKLQFQIVEKDQKIQKFVNDFEKQKIESESCAQKIVNLETQLNAKTIELQQIQVKIQQMLKKLKENLIHYPLSIQKEDKSKIEEIGKLIEFFLNSYYQRLSQSEYETKTIKEASEKKSQQMGRAYQELAKHLQQEQKKGMQNKLFIKKMNEEILKHQVQFESISSQFQNLKGQHENITLLNNQLREKAEDSEQKLKIKQEEAKQLQKVHEDIIKKMVSEAEILKQEIETIIKQQQMSEEKNHHLKIELGRLNQLLVERDRRAKYSQQKQIQINQDLKKQLILLQQEAKQLQINMRDQFKDKDGQLKKIQEQHNQIQAHFSSTLDQLKQNNRLLRECDSEIIGLTQNLEELPQKISEVKLNRKDSSLENEQNLNQINELSLMQSEINNFKQQLHELLATILEKDKQIQLLHMELSKIKQQERSKDKDNHETDRGVTSNAQVQKQLHFEEGKQKMGQTIIQQRQELERLRVQSIKHQILTKKLADLEVTLDKQKQMYQNQLIKNSKRIFELEDQISCLKKEAETKKRKVFSQEYFSVEPLSNNFSSKQKTSGDGVALKVKTVQGKPQSHQQISSQVFHSLEEDFVEEVQNRKKQEQELDNQKKLNRCRLRRQKSQGYDRKTPAERCYDSDQKLKQQKQLKVFQAGEKLAAELSPIPISPHEIKNTGVVNNKQKDGLKSNQMNFVSHEEIPLATNSDNSSLNEIIKGLSEENKQLKSLNQKLKKDFRQITEFMQIFDKTWKSEKTVENCSESGKLINTQKLLENLKLLEHSKIKLLEQFNSNDLESMFDSISKLIYETKRWVDLIQRLTSLNNKLTLEVALLKKYPKLVKTRTLRVGENDSHQRSRSVYSEGNVYKQHHIDVDESPFEMHDDHHHQPVIQQNNLQTPPNSLEILFKENVQMSEISSVKHKSHNSGFLNSKSEIAKMFEKGEKHDKDARQLKRQDIKKDIVDEYSALHQKVDKAEKFEKAKNPNLNLYQSASNNKIYQSRVQNNLLQNSPLMHKNSNNYYQEANNLQSLYNQKYEFKSNKAKRQAISKTASKLAAINSKINQHKKEYAVIIKNIIQKYEEKIAHLQSQFSLALRKIMQNSVPIELFAQLQKKDKESTQNPKIVVKPVNEAPPNNRPVVSNRISEKDEQTEEKIEQLEMKAEKQKKQIQNKDKSISQLKQQLKQAEKKLKEQRAIQQSLKSKYMNQVSHSFHLTSRIEKISMDFKNFLQKIIINEQKQKRKFKELGVQTQIQIQQFFSPTNMQNQKRFLKSKKNLSKPQSTGSDLTKEGNIALTKSQEFKAEKPQNQRNAMIPQISLIQQTPKMEDLKNEKPVQIGGEEGKQKKGQKNVKQESKQRQQIELSFGRIKSQAPDGKKKEEELRQSDRSEGQVGKSLTIGAIFNNIMNPNSNTLTKKKTISEASKPDQVIYYQSNLKDINKQIQELLAQYFKQAKIESEKHVELQDEIFKSKKQRETKTKTADMENQKERERQKQKEKESQKKLKDQEEIKLNIQVLEDQIVNFKKEASKSVGEREERLKLIIKKIVDAFKISKKSVDKVINEIEKKEANAAKYIDARLFFKNVYNEIKSKETQSKQDKQIPIKINKANSLDSQIINDAQITEPAYEFESYEEKYRALQKLNEKLRADLQAKSQQCILLKHDRLSHTEGKKNNSRQHSFVSNENSQQFQDFQHRELFDNTKPTFELVEELKMELEYYKKKCEQYELAATRKRTQKVKYIRKW